MSATLVGTCFMIPLSRLPRYVKRAPELVAANASDSAMAAGCIPLPRPPHRCIPVSNSSGGRGWLRTDSPEELRVFWYVFVRRCYRIPPRCQTIVDAGANIGVFSVRRRVMSDSFQGPRGTREVSFRRSCARNSPSRVHRPWQSGPVGTPRSVTLTETRQRKGQSSRCP